MTVGELRKLIEGVPDDYSVLVAATEGPKVEPMSGNPSEDDHEFVLFVEARRGRGRYRDLRIHVIDK